jgi:transposase
MKGVIIEVDIYSSIRTRFSEGESIRSIAKNLGISRQTVKKYCEGATHPDERKAYLRKPDVITDDVKSFILSCFKEDEEQHLNKQNHTAKRIFDRLVVEENFIGSYSSVRTVVKELKGTIAVPSQSSMHYPTNQVKQFKLTGEREQFTLIIQKLRLIFSVEGYATAVIFLFKHTNQQMKNPSLKHNKECLNTLEGYQND